MATEQRMYRCQTKVSEQQDAEPPEVEEREAGQHICEITLKNRNLTKAQFIQDASFTPSGVVRIAKLQKQGSAYIKP